MQKEMTPETLNALKLSIAHWERLASGKRNYRECVGVGDCALCGMFNNTHTRQNHTSCIGCPVKESTGQGFCLGTPFVEAEEISEQVDKYDEPLDSEEFQDAAQKELEFLKSLLPKES